MSCTTLPLSSATASLINRPHANACFSTSVAVSSFSATNCNANVNKRRKGWMISCEVSLKSNNSTASLELDNYPSVSMSSAATASDDGPEEAKIGARVSVKVPLKVYHIPRVPEVDLTGMEGVLKQYIVDFKEVEPYSILSGSSCVPIAKFWLVDNLKLSCSR